MSEHTPGPWKVLIRERESVKVVATDDRQTIVCDLLTPPGHITGDEDARLISQAWLIPELVEALREAADVLRRNAHAPTPRERVLGWIEDVLFRYDSTTEEAEDA